MNNERKIPASYSYKQYRPCRNQIQIITTCLDQLLPDDHKARAVWAFVEKMDTDPCFRKIKSCIHGPGRPTTSPEVLFALWLYSIIDGNISARKLEHLCTYHDAYKWIAGDVPINRTMLANFRSADPVMFDQLLTNSLAVMQKEELLPEEDMAQDGTRVKAFAGNNSYHREQKLEELREKATQYLHDLKEELKKNPENYDNRKKGAQLRAAKERKQRIDKAIESLKEFQKDKVDNNKKNHAKEPSEKDLKKVRASTTDPEVKRMKMGDGGYRLAYNIQFATGTKSKVIYGVDAVNTLDPGTLLPMMMQVHQRIDQLNLPPPPHWLGDSAYSGKDDVEVADLAFPNCILYAPPKTNKGVDPTLIRKGDSEAIKKWRQRIGSEEMKEIYKERPSSSEFANAQVKNKGFRELLVRGLKKVKGVARLYAILHNLQRYWDLARKKEIILATS